MTNVKGPQAGQPIMLLHYERWLLANLFGFVDRKTGKRRFRQASIWVPKGNGKTTLAADPWPLGHLHRGEGGAEGYSAAVSRTQARSPSTWRKAHHRKDANFRTRYRVRSTSIDLQPRPRSSFKALCSNAKALDGLNVHFAVLDEIASHRPSAVYDSLITATGKRTSRC